MKMPCIPHELPVSNLNWERLAEYTYKATSELTRFDGVLDVMINPALLLSPLTVREAILSSRIEGTQTTLVEYFRNEAGEQYNEEKNRDIQEVRNYRKALLTSEKSLLDQSITLQLICQMHAMLMDGVRGEDKNPGQFREDQNWIGKKGIPIERARFIPPSPLILREHMEKLQTFMESDYKHPLVQLALVHAQFEIIHPFKDGNGRLGRMIVPLFLYQKRVLQRPMFYLSEYLEETDAEYRDRLLAITEKSDWQGWIEFFLNAIFVQAKRNNEKARAIHNLYEEMKPLFSEATKSQFSQASLDAFFKMPIINSTDFVKISGISKKSTANYILKKLEAAGLIKKLRVGKAKTPAVYVLGKLINESEGKRVIDE